MRVTTKGQVTIPKDIRERLGITPGSEVEFVAREDGVRLEKRDLSNFASTPENFDAWAASVAGTLETGGMDGKEFIDWLRGPYEDLDPR